MSGWWTEQYAHFSLVLTPTVATTTASKSVAAMTISPGTPTFGMAASPTSTGEFSVDLAPNLSFLGLVYAATAALSLEPLIGMDSYASNSVASFGLSLTPTIGMTGAEHYTAAFELVLTPTIGQLAYIKQLPHPIPWTL